MLTVQIAFIVFINLPLALSTKQINWFINGLKTNTLIYSLIYINIKRSHEGKWIYKIGLRLNMGCIQIGVTIGMQMGLGELRKSPVERKSVL